MARTFASFDELATALKALGPEDFLAAVSLTPDLAADIMRKDPVNRKVRTGNLIRLKRDITEGFWDARKSSPLRFLPSIRLADGQHRCRAVIDTGHTITVSICVVPDTIGVDEGAGRTLVDHLQLSRGLDEIRAPIAAAVTKALCHLSGAGNREYLDFYSEQQTFITECVSKSLDWLDGQAPSVSAVFKPVLLATLRARAIKEQDQPAESVDQLLYDAVNGGMTAPDGSPRRALAKQFFDAMQESFRRKKAKQADILTWLIAALEFERKGVLKNIVTARLAGRKKRKSPHQLAGGPPAVIGEPAVFSHPA